MYQIFIQGLIKDLKKKSGNIHAQGIFIFKVPFWEVSFEENLLEGKTRTRIYMRISRPTYKTTPVLD
jgi:hypothetical protein